MSGLKVPENWISRGLSERTKQKAITELSETDERHPQALAELREQIQRHCEENPNLPISRQDDDVFLTMFLRVRKYNVERSMTMLAKYVKFRAEHLELFEGVTLDSVIPVLESKVFFVMRERDEEGRRVFLFQPARLDITKFTAMDMQRALVYVLDGLIQDEETQVNGFVMIEDYTDMTMTKILMFDQKLIKQVMELFQDAFPARFKAYHLINQPWFFKIVWAIAKPFMKEKMTSRVSHSVLCAHALYFLDRVAK